MEKIKVAFVMAMHQSTEIRPRGFESVNRYLTSLDDSCMYDYTVFLFDNSSTEKFPLSNYPNIDIRYTYVEDQTIRGLTGTWNDGVITAFNEGYDRIIVSSDDLIFNRSLNYLIANIVDDDTIYGPLCQPGGLMAPDSHTFGGNVLDKNMGKLHPQASDKPIAELIDVTGKGEVGEIPSEGHIIGGFLFGFTRNFYDKYKMEDGLTFNSGKKYMWGGQECEFQLRLWKKGVRSVLVGASWIYHEKIRSWTYHEKGKKSEQALLSDEKVREYQLSWRDRMEQLPFEEDQNENN
mgnify:CR=1 FL=1